MHCPKKPIKIFLIFLVTLSLFLFIFPKKISAIIIEGTSCNTDQECQELLETPYAKCLSDIKECGFLGSMDPNKWYNPTRLMHEEQKTADIENNTVSPASYIQYMGSTWINTLLAIGEGDLPKECQTDSQECAYAPGGTLGGISNLIVSLYSHPPASGVDYLADLSKNFGIISPAYAQQGIGFSGFVPLLPIWKAFRNITYLLFVIIFVIIGLALMFRVKISPQAVLTIESALPKIIIALILVTFSYAIAGFLIDLIYVLSGMIVSILGSTGLIDTQKALAVYTSPNTFTLVGEYMGRGSKIVERLSTIISTSKLLPAGILRDSFIDAVNFLKIGVIVSPQDSLLRLVLLIAILFSFFKLFFSLILVYVKIVLAVIIGPIQIAFGALPGQNTFSAWLKNLLANILVFPGVIGIFLLADAIMNASEKGGNIWSPPFLFSLDSKDVGSIIAFGLLLLAPKIPEYIKALFEPKTKVTPPGEVFAGFTRMPGTAFTSITSGAKGITAIGETWQNFVAPTIKKPPETSGTKAWQNVLEAKKS